MKSHSGERRSKREENRVGKSIKELGVLQKLKGDTAFACFLILTKSLFCVI